MKSRDKAAESGAGAVQVSPAVGGEAFAGAPVA